LFFDNYYTSFPLLVYLMKLGIYSLGTLWRNRIPNCKLPEDDQFKKVDRGTSEECVTTVDGVDISNVVWKDNALVHFGW
jgi:hypothetical protein